MPCMCGDAMCPSCGPAQGYNLKFEAAIDDIIERCPALEDNEDAQEQVANYVFDLLEAQREAILEAVEGMAKCRPGIIEASPPIIEHMTARQAVRHIADMLKEWGT